jgi:hypothetical protein
MAAWAAADYESGFCQEASFAQRAVVVLQAGPEVSSHLTTGLSFRNSFYRANPVIGQIEQVNPEALGSAETPGFC